MTGTIELISAARRVTKKKLLRNEILQNVSLR
jgi:hypothetical protein